MKSNIHPAKYCFNQNYFLWIIFSFLSSYLISLFIFHSLFLGEILLGWALALANHEVTLGIKTKSAGKETTEFFKLSLGLNFFKTIAFLSAVFLSGATWNIRNTVSRFKCSHRPGSRRETFPWHE